MNIESRSIGSMLESIARILLIYGINAWKSFSL